MKSSVCLTLFALTLALFCAPVMSASLNESDTDTRIGLASGGVNLVLDASAMSDLGISLDKAAGKAPANVSLQVDADASTFQLSRRDGVNGALLGTLATHGGSTWTVHTAAHSEKVDVGDFLIGFGGRYGTISDSRDVHLATLELIPETVEINFDPAHSHFLLTADIKIAAQFMQSVIGTERGIGNTVGRITIDGTTQVTNSRSADDAGGIRTTGPDVTVGELRGNSDNSSSQPFTWGTANGYVGYSAGTTSCNVGSTPLNWLDGQPNHPVIGQGLYRYSVVNGAGRFEQVGQSWLKHGFCALQGTVCLACSPFCGGCCDHLGVGCSDPYNANRNGGGSTSTRFMGAKAPVNPSTGVNDYGATGQSFPNAVAPNDDVTTGRLRALQTDVNPALNPGALYYVEGQYVAADDAANGNKNNNASYRRCTIGASPGFTMSWASTAAGQTVRQTQAIKAWGVNNPGVTYVDVDVPNDGRFTLGYKVTDLSGIGNGPWHYEYAVHNMNSDRAASTFEVPTGSGASISNTGFRDVDYYKDGYNYGTAYDGTDWPVTVQPGLVAWQMVAASPYENSNALRWATMYNFRFDANSPPQAGTIAMSLFKDGSPHGIQLAALVPSAVVVPCTCPGDLDSSLTVDGQDIIPFTAMYLAQMPVSSCADIAAPSGGPLDDADVNAFVDLLVNGSNVCK